MKKTRKVLTFMLAGVMSFSVFAFGACGGGNNPEEHLHTLAKTNAVAASCETAGNIDYWYCSGCEKYFSDGKGETEIAKADTVLKATGHNAVEVKKEESTCMKEGKKAHWHCSVCGENFSDEEAKNKVSDADLKIEKSAHTLSKVDEDPADCTNDGKAEHWHCSVCGKDFSDETGKNEVSDNDLVIPSSHALSKVDEDPATCTTDGKAEHWHCSVCGKDFSDEAGENEADEESLKIAAHHTLTKHDAANANWQTAGNIEYYTCSACNKYFSDEAAANEIQQSDVAVAPEQAPTGGETMFAGNVKANKDFMTPANWATFGDNNYTGYTTAVPTLKTEEESSYLEFASAARFELFHVAGTDGKFTHLGENSQTSETRWGNAAFAENYGKTFVYSFDVTANGAFAFEVFGLSGGKADRSAQGTSLLFDKNAISFSCGIGANQTLRAISTLPETFDIGDGEHHTVTLSITRSAPDGGNTVTVFKIYIDGYMIAFVNEANAGANGKANSDGVLEITIGNSGMGQRLSVIPQVTSEAGAETTTYSTVCIHDLKVEKYAPTAE